MPSKFWGEVTIFGIRISFVSNDLGALRTALSVFAKWVGSETPTQEPSVYIVLNARDAPRRTAGHTGIERHRLLIMRDGIGLRANGCTGRGVCVFSRHDVGGSAFREAIHTIVLFLVAHAGRIPVHASAIMIGDRAIVLAGKSGSGKSSLALAANRAGLPILSDDAVFVQLEPSFRIWALPEAVHVLERDSPGQAAGGTRFRSGRLKRAIPIANPRPYAERALLCVLARGKDVLLEEMHHDVAVSLLTEAPEPGFEFYGARSLMAVRAVAIGGCWRLTLSHQPELAIAALIGEFSDRQARSMDARS